MELKSPNSGESCTKAQYIAELVVSRKINKTTSCPPGHKFWNTQEWKPEFKRQVMTANSLLKLFSFEDILSALNSKDGNWMYTLTNKSLIDLIQKEKMKSEMERKILESQSKVTVDNNNTISKPKVQSKPSIRNSLLDD